jgi:hypothetical protein
MAPRSKVANISFTVESASEDEMTVDELNALPTPESNTENKAPTRKARGNAAQTKKAVPATKPPTKGRPATRRTSGSSVVVLKKGAKKAPAKGGRKALAERKETNGSDTEDVDDFEEEEPAAPVKPAKKGQPAKKAQEVEEVVEAAAPAKRGRKAAAKEPAAKEPAAKKDTKAKATVKTRGTKRGAEPELEPEHMTIPETQPEPAEDPMDISESIEIDEIPESMLPPPAVRPSAHRAHAQPNSRARRASAVGRRTGSVSDSERDPVMRRKVGDLTKKLDVMSAKYETLKEVASSGKESNFDQLKKRTDQTAKGMLSYTNRDGTRLTRPADQDAVIKSLQKQITDFQSRTADLTSLKKELASSSKENARLAAENKRITDSLTASNNENKNLSGKLAAARHPETKTVPGSAVKPRTTGVVLPGTAEAAKEATLAKQKVDLYSDLTNLVVLSIKKTEDDEEVYECLQTGRNGSKYPPPFPFPYLLSPNTN